MLVTLKEICSIAESGNMAVGAFNAVGLESLKSVIMAAEELESPVIIQFAQCHECYNSIEDMGPLMIKYAKKASVPVCVHLDHGEDLDFLRRALELGFTGIMFDGSTLGYEQNLELTYKAVQMAHEFSSCVEAELGSMGRRESGAEGSTVENDNTKIYTDPDMAARFVSETGIDALACSFGTTHGIYISEPKLNFDIVRKVRERTGGIPIVMHGGSGVSEKGFRDAITAGVRKINYFTYMDKSGASAIKERLLNENEKYPLFTELSLTAENAMRENVISAIKVFLNK